MKRLFGVMGCLVLAAMMLSCGPAIQHHSSPERRWGAPAQRYEGCCQSHAVNTSQLPVGSRAAQVEKERLRREAVEKRAQEFRDSMAKAEAERKRSEAERKAREAAKTKAREAAKATRQADKLCAELHPEAKYMTPPDEEGTQRWFPKQVEDFAGFADCFHRRHGGAFAAEDFRPCNSIPGITETERFDCLLDDQRPNPRQWCSSKFDSDGDYDSWKQCTNELLALDSMPLLTDREKTADEMREDEQDFLESASSEIRSHYRGCIAQFPRPNDKQRQFCRDNARFPEKLRELLEEFGLPEDVQDERPKGGLRPDEL